MDRFAGEAEFATKAYTELFPRLMEANKQLMKTRQREAMDNAYNQRARDVAATGVKNPGAYL